MNHREEEKYWRALYHDPNRKDELESIRWKFYENTSEYSRDQVPTNSLDWIPVLDGGYVALIDHMGTDIDIVNAARKSFNVESFLLDEKDKKLLKYLWKNRHTSPFEMVEFKFAVKAPLFVARQWMRHRTWSYNEVSRRYTSDRLDFYTPHTDWIRSQSKSNRQASEPELDGGIAFAASLSMMCVAQDLESAYYDLIDKGVAREQARAILPQSMYVEFVAKVNLWNLLHFLELRLDSHAQWEIQLYAEAILEMIENIVPETVKLFKESRKHA